MSAFDQPTGRVLLITLLLLGVTTSTGAEPEDGAGEAPLRFFRAAVGYQQFRPLADLEPAAPGRFDAGGYLLDLGVHRQIGRWRQADVLFGVDLGLFTNESDVQAAQETLTSRGLYLTPSVKLMFSKTGERYIGLEAGAGYYLIDFVEFINRDALFSELFEANEVFEESTLGGYLGISADFPVGKGSGGIFIGTRVHWFDLGPATALGPSAGDLTGPMVTVHGGWTQRF